MVGNSNPFLPSWGSSVKQKLNPILRGGGHYGPDDHKSFCRFQSTRVRLTKLFDFVISNLSFNWVKSVFPFVFEFFEKSRREKFRHPNWLGVKKIFGSDSAQISCVKSLGHKDFKFWISSKSETKKFFFPKGGPFDVFQEIETLKIRKTSKVRPLKKRNFFSPILMKLKIWNPYGLGISHMKFERNRSRKFFWHTLASGQNIRGDLWWRGCFWCLWKAKDHNIYLETNFGHLEVIWYIYMA